MMLQIGRMIFFDKITGEVIVDTGQWANAYRKKKVDEQIQTYSALTERSRETFDYVELEYGQYAQDFAECNGYRVDSETKAIEFSYPDPNNPDAPIDYQKPLSEEVKLLKVAQSETDTTLLELMEVILLG